MRKVNQNNSEIHVSYDALHERVQQVETAPIAQVERRRRGDERDRTAEMIHSEQWLPGDAELAKSKHAAEPMSLPSIVERNRRRQAQKNEE